MNTTEVLNKLIAEIERLKEETPIGICEYDKGEENGRMEVLTSLRTTIDSLQQEQPEVDLEKEIQSFWNANALEYRLGHVADINFLAYTARYFYELGLNARKV